MKSAVLALSVLALVAGCGQLQRLDRYIVGDRNAERVEEDPTELAMQVSTAAAERTPSGVIIRAEAILPSAGYYDAELRPVSPETLADGILRLEFRALPPEEPRPGPTPRSRTIAVAVFLDAQDLAGISQIQVLGQQQSQAVGIR